MSSIKEVRENVYDINAVFFKNHKNPLVVKSILHFADYKLIGTVKYGNRSYFRNYNRMFTIPYFQISEVEIQAKTLLPHGFIYTMYAIFAICGGYIFASNILSHSKTEMLFLGFLLISIPVLFTCFMRFLTGKFLCIRTYNGKIIHIPICTVSETCCGKAFSLLYKEFYRRNTNVVIRLTSSVEKKLLEEELPYLN